MPIYPLAPPAQAIMIEQGWPVYLLGSRQSIDAELFLTSVAVGTNVATVGVTSWSGPVPIVGALLSVSGTQTNSGIFNVVNAPITAVDLNAAGTGTISFALTNADIGTTTDAGKIIVTFPPVGEAIDGDLASMAGSVGNTIGRTSNGLSAQVFVTDGVTAITGALQGSNINEDAYFGDIADLAITSGVGGASLTETNFEFIRFRFTEITGSGTVIAVINA